MALIFHFLFFLVVVLSTSHCCSFDNAEILILPSIFGELFVN